MHHILRFTLFRIDYTWSNDVWIGAWKLMSEWMSIYAHIHYTLGHESIVSWLYRMYLVSRENTNLIIIFWHYYIYCNRNSTKWHLKLQIFCPTIFWHGPTLYDLFNIMSCNSKVTKNLLGIEFVSETEHIT